MKIGVRLYNFREALKQDFKGTIGEVAKMGFGNVESAVNHGGPEPAEPAACLNCLHILAC